MVLLASTRTACAADAADACAADAIVLDNNKLTARSLSI
jgi:hypothetical protein